ncbi:MAG: S8 family peptidase [Nodularia sp. CChRGM 3473]
MPTDDISNNFFPHKGLNLTSISSVDTFQVQHDYGWGLSNRSSLNLESAVTATSARTANYNSTSGYGLINAAAAVARAAGQNTFANVPNLGGNNWGADLIKAPAAWAQGYTGQGVVVAVLDTGIDYNHADLQNNIWTNPGEIPGNGIDDDGNGYVDDVQGWNFVNRSNNVLDVNGHGTHVAGTIAGENNGFGVTGIAYNAKIMPVKVLDDSGTGSFSAIADGIYYAVNNGANVINLSLGGAFPNSALESAIAYASSKGAIVVMAAGNNGFPFPGYPASYANNWGLAVGAVDRNNNMANFSNRAGTNPLAYVTAPGVGVYSSVPGNQYAQYSGTSMATPHVAGVVALMLSANPSLTDAQVRQIIIETAGNSTPVATSSFQISSLNLSSLVSQAISHETSLTNSFALPYGNNSQEFSGTTFPVYAEMVGNRTSATTINFDFEVIPLTASNTATAYYSSDSKISSMNAGIQEQFRYYDHAFSSNINNSISQDDDQNNGDFTDIETILSQFQKQLDELRRYFGGF